MALADPIASRRGRNNRLRGNSHELKIARRYGGTKTGPLGTIEDIRGKTFSSQVKTKNGTAPASWRKVFIQMDAADLQGRIPRLILRFLPGPGFPAEDFIVMRGQDFLDFFGVDE